MRAAERHLLVLTVEGFRESGDLFVVQALRKKQGVFAKGIIPFEIHGLSPIHVQMIAEFPRLILAKELREDFNILGGCCKMKDGRLGPDRATANGRWILSRSAGQDFSDVGGRTSSLKVNDHILRKQMR